MEIRPPGVSIQNIGKAFNDNKPILTDISIEAKPCEWIAFVGSSGCGKTTLLRLIANLIQPSSGRIEFTGNPNPEISFIFQDPTLLPWKDVIGNLKLPMELRKVEESKQVKMVKGLLRLTGLEDSKTKYPKDLSGGMKMRVSLARALSLYPELILFDEPFAALDAITRNRLNEELIRIRKAAQTTAFFVTHSVNEAVFLADKVAVMTPKGFIHSIKSIDFRENRTASLRETSEYQSVVAGINHSLQEALQV